MMKRLTLRMSLLALLCLTLAGCFGAASPARTAFFAMDTYITLEAYGKNAAEALSDCEAETARLTSLLSVTSETGDILRMNHADGSPTRVSTETANLLTEAIALSGGTDGAFDPTVYPLVSRWGFLDATQRVPTQDEIDSLLPLVGWENVRVEGETVTLPVGAGVDLGGIAKGYVTDRLVSLLRQRGVESALLSLGGNVYAVGANPAHGDWRIGVQNPNSADSVVGVVSVQNAAVVTAGSYQRYFTQDGQTYHHILDPMTGRPAESGLSSVTIVCESATRADALSTALFVMGLERATAFWRGDGAFAAVFVSADGAVSYTENCAFAPSNPDARKIAK